MLGGWRFSPKQRDSIANATARQNVWHGSVRSGKTVASIIAWLLFIREAPPGALLMVGKTERTLKRNVLDVVEQMLGPSGFDYNRGEGEATILGRTVLVAGANDARAEGKIRGLTLAGAYGDEVTLWPEPFYRQLLARMSVKGARLFVSTNPDGPYHWLKTGFLDRADVLNIRTFHFTLADNYALDPEYIADLVAEYQPGSLWHRRFIEGLWVAAEGAVYDFFDEDEHLLDEPPEREPDYVDLSVDYGTSNATSVGAYGSWARPTKGQPRIVRLDGYYYDGRATGRQKTDGEFADDLLAFMDTLDHRVRYIIMDPSAASFRAELRRRFPRKGPRVMKAKNDVLDGIRTQARMLRTGEYRIVRNSGNRQAIEDYGAYLWDTKAQDRGEDRPMKQHDHTKDEERYVLHTLYGQNVTDADTAENLYR